MSYQEMTIVGYLGKDPTLSEVGDGRVVTNFPVAVTDSKDKSITIWFAVSCWGTLAPTTYENLSVSDQVLVKGQLKHDKGRPKLFKRDDGTVAASQFEIEASHVHFLDRKHNHA